MIHPFRTALRPRYFLIAFGLLLSTLFIGALNPGTPAALSDSRYVMVAGSWWIPSLYLAQVIGLFTISYFRRTGRTMGRPSNTPSCTGCARSIVCLMSRQL